MPAGHRKKQVDLGGELIPILVSMLRLTTPSITFHHRGLRKFEEMKMNVCPLYRRCMWRRRHKGIIIPSWTADHAMRQANFCLRVRLRHLVQPLQRPFDSRLWFCPYPSQFLIPPFS
ncbi:hypothetical protein K438DRAFT_1689011 [Mycena galopus ATCC 62051]|nr:hypothetical protein K438DRAFT_1689011 [Mycena galopus ATCC 62051]